MLARTLLAFALTALTPAAMAQTPDAASGNAPATVRVPIGGHNGEALSGLAVFTEGPQGVLIRLRVNDLPVQARGQWHAVHLHETADCSGRGFTASGSHINPDSVAHGLLNPMGPAPADLPNIWADATPPASPSRMPPAGSPCSTATARPSSSMPGRTTTTPSRSAAQARASPAGRFCRTDPAHRPARRR